MGNLLSKILVSVLLVLSVLFSFFSLLDGSRSINSNPSGFFLAERNVTTDMKLTFGGGRRRGSGGGGGGGSGGSFVGRRGRGNNGGGLFGRGRGGGSYGSGCSKDHHHHHGHRCHSEAGRSFDISFATTRVLLSAAMALPILL